MHRRAYLGTCAGGIAGLAGCSGILGDSDDTGSGAEDRGPAETVEAYYDALYADEVEEANSYVHPDGQLPSLTDSRVQELTEIESTYDATVAEREGEVATVTIEFTADADGGTWTAEDSLVLRQHDSIWKLYARPNAGVPSSPTEVSRALIEALIDGDIETANQLIHPDSPDGEVGQSNVEGFQSADASIVDITVESRNDSTATVNVVLGARAEDGDSGTVTFPFALRTHDGEWRVYEDLRATGSPPRAPAVQWETSERTDADGSITAVEFQHAGGDAVDAGTLRVAIDQTVATPEGSGSLAVADSVVAAFTAGDEGHDAGSTVSLRWTPPNVDVTRTLAQHELESGTSGRLDATARIE